MNRLKNKKVLVSAGPTYERIDDVRFIGNFSSGKMGFALAESARAAGASVTLVSGPSSLDCNEGIKRIDIESAQQMYDAMIDICKEFDVVIMAAAVADYTPAIKYDGKLKKKSDRMTIDLVKTRDILKEMGRIKPDNQTLVGFALESTNLLEYAKGKLENKNCNIIVANKANTPNSGFNKDVNTITIIDDKGSVTPIETASKKEIANVILNYIAEYSELP
jgi:phosphopantothenoylcysteine decarboxylase/phosphopantothenate--cysteine ligase